MCRCLANFECTNCAYKCVISLSLIFHLDGKLSTKCSFYILSYSPFS